jgi:hypothetical protein
VVSLVDRLNVTLGAQPVPLPGFFVDVDTGSQALRLPLAWDSASPVWDRAGWRTQHFSTKAIYPAMPDVWPMAQFNSWGYNTGVNEQLMMHALNVSIAIGLEAFVIDLGWQDTLPSGDEPHLPFLSFFVIHFSFFLLGFFPLFSFLSSFLLSFKGTRALETGFPIAQSFPTAFVRFPTLRTPTACALGYTWPFPR